MTVDVLEKFEREADAMTAKADADDAAVKADAHLSDAGKVAKLEANRAEYARAMDVLQYRAGEMVRAELEDADEALADVLGKAAKAERDMLGGPGVALELLRLEVGEMSVAELAALADGARDQWERAALPRVAAVELRRRLKVEPQDKPLRDALLAVEKHLQPSDPAVKELQDKIAGLKGSGTRTRIERLNRRAFQRYIDEHIMRR